MKKDTIYKLLIVFLVLINGVTLYITFTKRGHRDMRFELVDQLQMNGQQKEAVLDLQRKHFKIKDQLMDQNRRLNDSLFNLLKKASVDTVISNSILNQLSERHEYIEKMTFQHFVDVAKICNTAQKQKLVDAITHTFHKNLPPPKHD
jgi:hypothetical protein